MICVDMFQIVAPPGTQTARYLYFNFRVTTSDAFIHIGNQTGYQNNPVQNLALFSVWTLICFFVLFCFLTRKSNKHNCRLSMSRVASISKYRTICHSKEVDDISVVRPWRWPISIDSFMLLWLVATLTLNANCESPILMVH